MELRERLSLRDKYVAQRAYRDDLEDFCARLKIDLEGEDKEYFDILTVLGVFCRSYEAMNGAVRLHLGQVPRALSGHIVTILQNNSNVEEIVFGVEKREGRDPIESRSLECETYYADDALEYDRSKIIVTRVVDGEALAGPSHIDEILEYVISGALERVRSGQKSSLNYLNLTNNVVDESGKALRSFEIDSSLAVYPYCLRKNHEVATAKSCEVLQRCLCSDIKMPWLDLGLARNWVRDEGVFYLSKILESESLRALDLEDNGITDSGIEFLAEALKVNHSLCVLNLSGNSEIGERGIIALANALEENQNLQHLHLKGLKISSSAAEALAQAIQKNRSLVDLNLSGAQFENESDLALIQKAVNSLRESISVHNKFLQSRIDGNCRELSAIENELRREKSSVVSREEQEELQYVEMRYKELQRENSEFRGGLSHNEYRSNNFKLTMPDGSIVKLPLMRSVTFGASFAADGFCDVVISEGGGTNPFGRSLASSQNVSRQEEGDDDYEDICRQAALLALDSVSAPAPAPSDAVAQTGMLNFRY